MKFKNIELFEEPKYGSVKRVRGLRDNWLLRHIPFEVMEQKGNADTILAEYMRNHMDVFADFTEYLDSINDIGLVMLCSTLTYNEVKEIQDEFSEKDFLKLLEKCKDILGGTVEDFLKGSTTGTRSKTKPQVDTPDEISAQ